MDSSLVVFDMKRICMSLDFGAKRSTREMETQMSMGESMQRLLSLVTCRPIRQGICERYFSVKNICFWYDIQIYTPQLCFIYPYK